MSAHGTLHENISAGALGGKCGPSPPIEFDCGRGVRDSPLEFSPWIPSSAADFYSKYSLLE